MAWRAWGAGTTGERARRRRRRRRRLRREGTGGRRQRGARRRHTAYIHTYNTYIDRDGERGLAGGRSTLPNMGQSPRSIHKTTGRAALSAQSVRDPHASRVPYSKAARVPCVYAVCLLGAVYTPASYIHSRVYIYNRLHTYRAHPVYPIRLLWLLLLGIILFTHTDYICLLCFHHYLLAYILNLITPTRSWHVFRARRNLLSRTRNQSIDLPGIGWRVGPRSSSHDITSMCQRQL